MEAEHGQGAMMSSGQLPVGFRFMPTDKELITHYLMNKVFHRPVPAAEAIQDIDATQFYSTHPKNLGNNFLPCEVVIIYIYIYMRFMSYMILYGYVCMYVFVSGKPWLAGRKTVSW